METPTCAKCPATRIYSGGMCSPCYARALRARKGPCIIDGCDRTIANVTNGWCSAHYQRYLKHGDPLGGKPSPRTAKALDFPDGTRQCVGPCGLRKDLAQFGADKGGTLGRRSECKECRAAYEALRYARDGEKRRAAIRDARRANPDKAREQDRKRYERDKEKRLALAKAHTHKRRTRIKGGVWERGVTDIALRKRDGDKCCYCSKIMSFTPLTGHQYNPDRATVEHVVPISKGGAHTMDNTKLACWECNIRRGNREEL